MKTPAITFAAILAAALPWYGVQADEKEMPERGPIPFEVYDQNGDGYVSAEEFAATRNQRIEEKAREGYPMRGLKEHGAPSFEAFDRDGDGKLNREELQAGQMQRWQERREERWENKMQRGSGPMSGPRSGGGPNR